METTSINKRMSQMGHLRENTASVAEEVSLILSPQAHHYEEFYQNCARTPADLAHLNAHVYPGGLTTSGEELLIELKDQSHCYFLYVGGEVVGLLNYGEMMDGLDLSFGLALGRCFSGRGYGKAAVRAFIALAPELGINDINAYCLSSNRPMRRVLEANGLKHQCRFIDFYEGRINEPGLMMFSLDV